MGTHYDSLISYESDKEHIKYFRVKQKEYWTKNKAKLIENKLSNLFAGERIDKCSGNFVSSIYEYLINDSYPEEIKKIKNTFKRKNAKSKFKRLAKQNKKYKIDEWEESKERRLMYNLSYNNYYNRMNKANDEKRKDWKVTERNQRKAKDKFDELFDQINNEYLIKVENIVIEYDWKEIPKEVDKNDVIYRAHTQNKGHHRKQNTKKLVIENGFYWENMEKE